jgi:hypothetical protein
MFAFIYLLMIEFVANGHNYQASFLAQPNNSVNNWIMVSLVERKKKEAHHGTDSFLCFSLFFINLFTLNKGGGYFKCTIFKWCTKFFKRLGSRRLMDMGHALDFIGSKISDPLYDLCVPLKFPCVFISISVRTNLKANQMVWSPSNPKIASVLLPSLFFSKMYFRKRCVKS